MPNVEKHTNAEWNTDSSIHTWNPAAHYIPKTLDDIRTLVREASERKIQIRAHGAGHSYSDVTHVDNHGWLLDMSQIKGTKKTETHCLKSRTQLLAIDSDPDLLVDVKAGTTIKDANGLLEKLGLAFSILGSYNGQAIWGAMSNSTHGTGWDFGPIHEIVRSITMVSTGGKTYRIEPANGITDPAKWKDTSIQLVQNDDWFNSVLVSMGCMGICYEITVRVKESFWLEEITSYHERWAKGKEVIDDLSQLQNNRHVDVIIHPNTINGKRSIVITKRNKTEKPGDLLSPNEDGTRRTFFSEMASGAIWLLEKFAALIPGQDKRSIFASVANAAPMEYMRMIDSTMKSLEHGRYVNKSYEVFFIGGNITDFYGIEWAIPYSRYNEAVTALFKTLDQCQQEGDIVTCPMGLRVVKGSRAYLSPQYSEPTVMLELGQMAGTKNGEKTLRRVQRALAAVGARPHWGLHLTDVDSNTGKDRLINESSLTNWYPKFKEWKTVYKELNYKGIFNNSFTDRIGISVNSKTVAPK